MAFKLVPEETKHSNLSGESFHRLPTQALKGVVSQAVGYPGDLASLLNDFVAAPLSEGITGQKKVPYEETPIGKLLPTSAQHKKNLEQGIDYLKPKNKVEKFISDVASDTTALALPGLAYGKLAFKGAPALKSFATALGANAGGEFVNQFTGDEKKGAYTKMGMMFLGSLLNKPSADKHITELYKKRDSLLPEGALADARKTEANLYKLRRDILQGRSVRDLSASEKFVIDEADKVLRNIDGGEVNVKTLEAMKRSLNENLQKFVFEAADKGTKSRVRVRAKEINGYLRDAMKEYGKKNPQWWQLQKNADEAFGAMQQSNFIQNFINKNFKSGSAGHGVMNLLGVGADTVTGAFLPYQAVKILYRMQKSPELAKHYSKVLNAAAAENAPLMNKEIKKLDEKVKKEEKSLKSKYKLID